MVCAVVIEADLHFCVGVRNQRGGPASTAFHLNYKWDGGHPIQLAINWDCYGSLTPRNRLQIGFNVMRKGWVGGWHIVELLTAGLCVDI